MLWSISGCRNGWRGCTSLSLASSRLNAGDGIGRRGSVDVAVAAAAERFAVSDTFRLDNGCDCDCADWRYGDTAAFACVVENVRALETV